MLGFKQGYGLIQGAAQITAEVGVAFTGGELNLPPNLVLRCLGQDDLAAVGIESSAPVVREGDQVGAFAAELRDELVVFERS